jgi:GWxTD domain-containing protein
MKTNDGDVHLSVQDGAIGSKMLTFSVSMATFTPGEYSVIISNTNDTSEKYVDTFNVQWNDIPQSLINPEYAAEQMHVILTDDEYKKLKDGNRAEIFANILRYWEQNDPTPATKYNEKMATFFTRVDAANTLYQTLTQKKGATSDRGKVFILNGKPDKVETNIKGKKSYEVWTYNKLRKRYTFEIVSVGNYVLTEDVNI